MSQSRFLVPTIDAGDAISWLLRDEFTTDDAAPLQNALASAGSATVGTETNTYAATAADDGTNWEIAEEVGTPGLTLTMNFTAPVSGQNASQLIIYGYYDGNAAHTVNVEAYDWVTLGYDILGTLPDAVAEAVYTFTLDADHTDTDGSILIRINHTSAGNVNHTVFLDWVYVQDLVRQAEPGPGTLTFDQTDGDYAISSSALAFPAQTTPTWGEQGFWTGALTRAAGLALFNLINLSTWEECGIGWHTAAADADPDSMEHAIQANTADGRLDNHNATRLIGSLSLSTDYLFAQILRSTGALQFIRIGATWQLLWVDVAGATATLYPAFANLDAVGTLDMLRAVQMPQPFANDYGYVTERNAGIVAESTTFVHEADFHLEFIITTITTGDSTRVFFRKQDADNHWRVSITAAGTIVLTEVVATVPTSRGSAGAGLSGGERIVTTANDETITVFYDNTQAFLYSSAANFKTETDGELERLGTTAQVNDLITWPSLPSGTALALLNKYTKA